MINSSNILFVVNPKAGGSSKQELYTLLEQYSKELSFEYKVIETTGAEHQDQQTIRNIIATEKPETIAAVGGDGTVRLVVSLVMGTQINLAIIPMGSANGMAADLEIPNDVDEALRIIFYGRSRQIDLMEINGKPALHLGDVGLNAKVINRFEKDSRRGLFSYAKQLWRELFLIRSYSFTITTDGGIRRKRKAFMISFANGRMYGSGALINPIGKLDDGKFELCIFRSFPFYYFFVMVAKFFLGTINTSKYVEVISCKHAKIRSDKKLLLQTDGELLGRTDKIRIRVRPKFVKVIF